jgi:glycosyltransferase involved in cell wall biosynthesis
MPRVASDTVEETTLTSTGLVYEETSLSDSMARQAPEVHGRVVAVIPAYNEDRFIGSVVLKILPYVDWVVVVDDGSKDRTAHIARQAGADVLVHCVNRGKAKALQTGFARALELGADVVVILDGDGQHNPEEIPIVAEPILRDQADMVIGSRFRETKSQIPIWRQFGQHALTLATNVASGVPSSDSQSGFRAFRASALASLEISGEGFSIESELQFWAREQRLRVKEAPISVIYAEKAKRNPVQQALQVLNGILALVSQLRPLFFFGLTGAIVSVLGVVFWSGILHTYNTTGQLSMVPVIVATLLLMLGVLAIFEGITLHTMRQMMVMQQKDKSPTVAVMTDRGSSEGQG